MALRFVPDVHQSPHLLCFTSGMLTASQDHLVFCSGQFMPRFQCGHLLLIPRWLPFCAPLTCVLNALNFTGASNMQEPPSPTASCRQTAAQPGFMPNPPPPLPMPMFFN